MKRLFKSAMLVAAAAAFAAGCSKDIAEDVSGNIPEVKKITVSATAYTPAEDGSSRTEIGPSTNDGKSYPLNWSTNATEQIFVGEVLENATSNIHYRRSDNPDCTVTLTVENAKTATATVSKTAESSGGSYHAVYPASAVSDLIYDDAMGKVIYIDFPRNQTMPAKDQVDPAGTILYAKYEDADGTATNIEFDFNHLAAYGKMTVKNFKVENAADGEMIKEVRLIAKNEVDDEIPHKLSGQFFYYFDGASQPSDSEYLDYPTQYSDVVVNVEALNLKASDAGEFVVWFTTLPDKDIKDFALRITTTGGRTFRRGVAIPEGKNLLTFNAGKIKAFSVDMATAEEYVAGSGEVYEQVTDLNNISEGDYIFLAQKGDTYYTLSNQAASASNVTAVDISTIDIDLKDNIISGDATGYNWSLTSLGNYWKINSKSSSDYLYSTKTNDGIVVGTNYNYQGEWSFEKVNNTDYFHMLVKAGDDLRYFALYDSKNWRSYTALQTGTSQNHNIMVFKKGSKYDGPAILAENIIQSPSGDGDGIFSYDLTGFDSNDVKVEITDYDGNVSFALIDEEKKEVNYILEPNFSDQEVISEIGLTATATVSTGTRAESEIVTAVLRVQIKQAGTTPISVNPERIVVYSTTETTTLTVISPDFDWTITSSDPTQVALTGNSYKATTAAGRTLTLTINASDNDPDYVLSTLTIKRNGESARNAVKVLVVQASEGDIQVPQDVTASASTNLLTASWGYCDNVDSYEWVVVAGDDPNDVNSIKESGEKKATEDETIDISTAVTNLTAGETYNFFVRSKSNGGYSEWSAAAPFTVEVKQDPLDLTFDFTSNPGNWPTTSSAGNYIYKLNGVDYTFNLSSNVTFSNSYLFLQSKTEKGVVSVGLPAIVGYKLTSVIVNATSGASTNASVGIFTSSKNSSNAVSGGTPKLPSNRNYTFNLTGTVANTVYYLSCTTSSYNAQIATLVLHYEPDGSGNTGGGTPIYKKITTDGELESGEYLIVYETGNVAFDGNLNNLDSTPNTISITINNKTIQWSETLAKSSFTYDANAQTLRSASGYYIGRTSEKNGIDSSTTTAYTNTVSINSSGDAEIKSGSTTLLFNSTAGQNKFRYFTSSQQAVQLYKKVVE